MPINGAAGLNGGGSIVRSRSSLPGSLSILVALFLGAGCAPKSELIVATVSRDWFNAPVLLVQQHREVAGAKIETFDQKSGLASKNAVQAGHADIGLASPVPLLCDPSCWDEIVILGVYMRSAGVIGTVSRGKATSPPPPPYGIVKGTISQVYFAALDRRDGGQLSRDGSRILDIQPPDAGTQLANGAINTAVVWEPHLARAQARLGLKGSLEVETGLYTVHVALLTSRTALKKNRAQILAFRDLVKKKCGEISASPDSARKKVESILKIDPDLLKRAWSTVDFGFVENPADLASILQREATALGNAKMIDPAQFSMSNAATMLKY